MRNCPKSSLKGLPGGVIRCLQQKLEAQLHSLGQPAGIEVHPAGGRSIVLEHL